MSLSIERLNQLLDYDPETGLFRWKASGKKKRKDGLAGCTSKVSGYVAICIDYKIHYAHRLAWLAVTGEWPVDQIDHRDGVRSNNGFANLRQATSTQNNVNRRSRGYWWDKEREKWCVHVSVGNRGKHVGRFDLEQDAKEAYLAACAAAHGEAWLNRKRV